MQIYLISINMILIFKKIKGPKHLQMVLNFNNKKKKICKIKINKKKISYIKEILVYKQKIIIYFLNINIKIMDVNKWINRKNNFYMVISNQVKWIIYNKINI